MGSVKQHIAALFVSIGFFFFLFLSTGMFGAGTHFKDGVRLTEYNKDIKSKGLQDTFHDVINGISTKRLTPVHVFHQLARSKVFGSKTSSHYAYMSVLAGLCCFFLYLFMRTQGFSFLLGLLFGFLTLMGQQAAPWWQLGTAEPIGMFLLSVTLFFMGLSSKSKGPVQALSVIIFVIGLVLCSLSKESFILIVPAVLFWKIWMDSQEKNISFKEAAYSNLWLVILLLGIMFLELRHILAKIGTKTELLAQVDLAAHKDTVSHAIEIVRDLKMSVFVLLEALSFAVVLFGGFLVTQADMRDLKKKVLPLAVLFILILIPQVFLYSGTGLRQRFWLPAFLAFSYALVYLLKEIIKNPKTNVFTRKVFIILVLLVFIPRVGHTFFKAKITADEGKAINNFVGIVINNTDPASRILMIADPVMNVEAAVSFEYFLSSNGGRSDCKVMFLGTGRIFHTEEISRALEDQIRGHFEGREIEDASKMGEPDCITLFPGLEEVFLGKAKDFFDRKKYRRTEIRYFEGSMVVYTREK